MQWLVAGGWLWILLGLALLVGLAVWWTGRRPRFADANKKIIQERWREIAVIKDDNQKIIAADKVLDYALTSLGWSGSTADKFKKFKVLYRDGGALLNAHRFRNKIAHEINFKLTAGDAVRAMKAYQSALYKLLG